jgi:ABC-type transport system involved in multi-copper enzyme maturation permease subunit
MTRFAWLQARTQTLTAAVLIGALAVVAAITGVHLAHLYSSLVAHCHTGCDLAVSQFSSHDHGMSTALDLVAQFAPALLGIFWGAPLVARELETGTFRLVWTQSVSRKRWLVTKLALGALMTVTAGALITLTITWWNRGLDIATSNQYDLFDRRNIVLVAYAAFAFAVGALVGAIIRRTLPAMAATLAVYTLARIAATIIRPRLLSPTHTTIALTPADIGIAVNGTPNGPVAHFSAHGSGPPNSWTLSSHIVTKSGHVPTPAQIAEFLHQNCPSLGAGTGGGQGPQTCINQMTKTFHLLVNYLPADRYWTLQWLESGVFAAAAIAAAISCYLWVTRRIS